MNHWCELLLAASLMAVTGCNMDFSSRTEARKNSSDVIAEGTIYSVKYEQGDGKIGGFTRLDSAAAVPGGNGLWGVDAHGKLTREALVITYPKQAGLGPHVIPYDRILDVQFGDGGIALPKVSVTHGDHASHDHGGH